eukprot:1113639-Pleurochrysis_carterae.AAC.1
MVQDKVEICFSYHLDMLFHKHNKSIPLEAGYGLHVRPLNSGKFEREGSLSTDPLFAMIF